MILFSNNGQPYASQPGDLAALHQNMRERYKVGVQLVDEHSEVTDDDHCVRCATTMPCPPWTQGEWLIEMYADRAGRVDPALFPAPPASPLAAGGAQPSSQE